MDNPILNEYRTKRWYNENGELHREDGPAREFAGYKEYWVNDKRYNTLEEGLMNEALK